MQTFDIMKKIHRPGINRFDGVILWYGFGYKNKSGDDMTKLDVINFRAEVKIHIRPIQKIMSCQF